VLTILICVQYLFEPCVPLPCQEYADAGTVKQNYVNILLMLLRLRQACDHPLLVRPYDSSSLWRSSAEMAKKLPRDKQIHLLNCLEASLAICGICNVCTYFPIFGLVPLSVFFCVHVYASLRFSVT
jgi:hypothetical protein